MPRGPDAEGDPMPRATRCVMPPEDPRSNLARAQQATSGLAPTPSEPQFQLLIERQPSSVKPIFVTVHETLGVRARPWLDSGRIPTISWTIEEQSVAADG